ncbi:MAG: M20/M25/M40 family metallo-hydrolase [Gemmatimonadetes bacterium]|nr:M20/M25/M40 family metallo-hydrolase [Gemmatimonadota bacterium]
MVRAYLSSVLEAVGLEPRGHRYRENGESVYALLPSTTHSDDLVVVGAHFDTVDRSPGASDNATGCAAVLAVARGLSALPVRKRNVVVVLFDEEERGLVGSRAFAEKLVEEGKRVVAVHTIDQMGWDGDGDGAIELEVPYDGAVDLYRRAAAASGFSGAIHVTRETGSDHTAFRRLGMPAVGLTEEYRNGDTTPHIHQSTDTWDTVDFEFLAGTTRLLEAAMGILLGEGKPNGRPESGHRAGGEDRQMNQVPVVPELSPRDLTSNRGVFPIPHAGGGHPLSPL